MNASRMIRGGVLIGTLASAWFNAGSARSAGPVVGWGLDNLEQASPPASVNGSSGTVIAISGGYFNSCAIQAGTRAVICWGRNFNDRATPPASVNGTSGTAIAIAAGGGHSLAIAAPEPTAIALGTVSLGSMLARARQRRSH